MKFPAQPILAIAMLLSAHVESEAANIRGKVHVPQLRDNANAVIYIEKIPGKTFPPPRMPVPLDQLNLTFMPHVLPILVGTRVDFPNSDVVRHNVFSPGPTQKFTLGTYPVGTTRQQVFDKPGVITLLCNIHAEMSAYIVVTETPYWAVSDSSGNYTIAGVPPGRYVLRVWHERFSRTPTVEITVADQDLNGVNFDLKK
jgi:hypothetical protein